MQTLINNFHGTEAHTRLTAAEMDDIETRSAVRPEAVTAAERATVRRVCNHLCGISGCVCGDFWGRRA